MRAANASLPIRDASAACCLFQTDAGVSFDSLSGYGVVYLSAITLAILPPDVRHRLLHWLGGFRRAGGLFAFDSNYRPRLWTSRAEAQAAVAAAWQVCDLGLPSVDDEIALFGDRSSDEVLARLRDWGVRNGALKCGAAGPRPMNPATPAGAGFAPAAMVIDTTAAGDSFNAGYLATVLTGASDGAALHRGHAKASRVIGQPGAIVPREVWDTKAGAG